MRIPLIVVKLHRWLGLFLGIQVILWISGGVVMSVISIDKVRGTDRAQPPDQRIFSVDSPLLSPTEVARQLGLKGITGAVLSWRLDRAVYRLDTGDEVVVADAVTGKRLAPLTAEEARAVAEADYAGDASVAAVTRQEEAILEIRGREPPLWRVEFDDGRRTTIYVDPESGMVAARRNRLWRIYDVFWMLHIMDYRARDDFNHPLLVGSAAVAWFLATSGAWLVVIWLRRKRRRVKERLKQG